MGRSSPAKLRPHSSFRFIIRLAVTICLISPMCWCAPARSLNEGPKEENPLTEEVPLELRYESITAGSVGDSSASASSQANPKVIHIIDNANKFEPLTSIGDAEAFDPEGVEREVEQEDHPEETAAEGGSVFNMVINKKRRQRSAFISPDVDWLRALVPRVVPFVDQSEEKIQEAVFSSTSIDGTANNRPLLVNVVKSSVANEEEVPRVLDQLKDLLRTGGLGIKRYRSGDGINSQQPLVLNIIIFNLIVDPVASSTASPPLQPEHEPLENSYAHRGYDHQNRPLTAMEEAYLHPYVQQEEDQEEHYYNYPQAAVVEEPEDPSVFYSSLSNPSVLSEPTFEAVVAENVPEPSPPQSSGNRVVAMVQSTTSGMRNRMKTIGFTAIPTIAGLATTWQLWWPAVAGFAGRRKREAVEERIGVNRDPADARAIEEKWLKLLLGKQFSNVTKQELKATVDNWKFRNNETSSSYVVLPAATIRPQRFPQPLQVSRIASSTTPQLSRTSRGSTLPSTASTPAPDGASSIMARTAVTPEYRSGGIDAGIDPEENEVLATDRENHSSSTYHVVPVSSSGDFDIVANFVKSTLSKMVDTTDLDNDVFVINRPTVPDNIDNSAIGSALLITATSVDSTGEPTDSTGPVSVVDVFTDVPAMPSLPATVTNSPITFVSVKPVLVSDATDVQTQRVPPTTVRTTTRTRTTTATTTTTTKTTTPAPTKTTTVELILPSVPFSEPYVKSTRKPVPDSFVVDPFEVPNTLLTSTSINRPKPSAVSPTVGPTISPKPPTATSLLPAVSKSPPAVGSTRPSNLVTLLTFRPTSRPSIQQTSNSGNRATPPPASATLAPLPTTASNGESSLVSDVLSTQQILADLLKNTAVPVRSTTTPRPVSTTSNTNPSSSTIPVFIRPPESDQLAENSDYEYEDYGAESNPTGSQNAAPVQQPIDPNAISGVIEQLRGNLTTGLIGSSFPSAGIHFVNATTDVVMLNPFDPTPPTVVFDFEGLSVEPVVAEESDVTATTDDTLAVTVNAAPSLEGAPPPSEPDVNPNANLFLGSSGTVGVISIPSLSISSSSSTSSTSTTSTSVSNSVVFSLVVIGLAATAYTAVALLPLWVPLVGKKRRTYDPPRQKYSSVAASYANELGQLQSSYLYGPPAYRHGKRRRR